MSPISGTTPCLCLCICLCIHLRLRLHLLFPPLPFSLLSSFPPSLHVVSRSSDSLQMRYYLHKFTCVRKISLHSIYHQFFFPCGTLEHFSNKSSHTLTCLIKHVHSFLPFILSSPAYSTVETEATSSSVTQSPMSLLYKHHLSDFLCLI